MVKYHAQFLLDKEKENPTAKLRYRIKWDGNIVSFNVGYRIEIDKWSLDTQRCINNTSHGIKKISASTINREISRFEAIAEKVFSEFSNRDFNADDFRNKFNESLGRNSKLPKEKSLFEIFDEFIDEEGKIKNWTAATYTKMKGQKRRLSEFDSELSFENLTVDKLSDYQYYLQEDLQFKNSTILKQFSFLKWFLKWAKKKNYIKNNDWELFKPKVKTAQKKIIFLTQEEIVKLKTYKISKDKAYLGRVRDVFLFQCYTGLRYSDVANLRKNDIKNDIIEITTVKTNDTLQIELNNHSKKILNKYARVKLDDDLALPVISNQKMNEYLKELAELAEIDEPIRQTYYIGNKRFDEVLPKHQLLGTHAGRRTFICNALSLGIPPHVVMKWTGHSDYKAMKPYIDIADEIKASAMSKFNKLK